MNDNCKNWLQVLESQVNNNPEKIAFSENVSISTEENEISYRTLSERVKSLAFSINQQCDFGDRVIILMPNSIDYVVGFFACVYAGVIAVPAYPPHKKKRDWSRLNSIVNDCNPIMALHQADDAERITSWLGEYSLQIKPFAIDLSDINNAKHWCPPALDKHDVAYLQYSSGSTGTPKGVMLSHDNLINNTQLIIDNFEITEADKFINWLPLYHDMGFVGGILSPIRIGAKIHLLPSAKVAQSPLFLFETITKHEITATAAPNFIFDIAVEKISSKEKQHLDLSKLRLFVNGAEPINAKTLTKFNEYFSDNGLSPKVVKPSYGMAEACLLVTYTQMNSVFNTIKVDENKLLIDKVVLDAVSGKDIASSGILLPEITVKIVDKQSRVELPNGYVGEIMLKGKSISRGYWQKPELNVTTFDQTVGDNYGFMATGDLGFIETQSGKKNLFVTGRQKELLIINGCNYYPQDIEHTLLTLSEQLMPHGAAIFEVNTNSNTKEVVLIQELTRKAFKQKNYQEIIKKIRALVAEVHELKLTSIVLLKPATLAKTSSGKIQRLATRNAYIDKQLSIVDSWQQDALVNIQLVPISSSSANDIATWVMQWIAIRLSVDISKLSATQQLTQIGLDSIDAMTLTHELSKQLGLNLAFEVSWSYPSIEALAHYLEQEVSNKESTNAVKATPTEGMI
ncbi:MAG: acyl-CoA synthetase (AMP-forming)/AMP-acid ligase II/acyl carrier protein [Colwellia sp.]|jgi:acyl-CoA synthetase (AMP-forming)/AMP-acid ligase II/acyl carrier protein